LNTLIFKYKCACRIQAGITDYTRMII